MRKLQIAGVGQRGVQLAQPAGWSSGDAQQRGQSRNRPMGQPGNRSHS